MKSCFVGMLIILFGQWATAQVDSSTFNYIHKHSFQNPSLAQLKIVDFPTVTRKMDSNIRIRICVPSKQLLLNSPLFVIKSHNKTFIISDSSFKDVNAINPHWIKAINVLKGDQALNNYGEAGKNGVIEMTLDDDKYPEAFKLIQINSKKEQP